LQRFKEGRHVTPRWWPHVALAWIVVCWQAVDGKTRSAGLVPTTGGKVAK